MHALTPAADSGHAAVISPRLQTAEVAVVACGNATAPELLLASIFFC